MEPFNDEIDDDENDITFNNNNTKDEDREERDYTEDDIYHLTQYDNVKEYNNNLAVSASYDDEMDISNIDERTKNIIKCTKLMLNFPKPKVITAISSFKLLKIEAKKVTRNDVIDILFSDFTEDVLYDSAIVLLNRNEVNEATARLEACILNPIRSNTQTPLSAAAFTFLIEIYTTREEFSHALATAQQFRIIHGLLMLTPHACVAVIYLITNQFDLSIEACNEGLRNFPKSEILSSIRGKCYYKKGEYKLAVKDFHNSCVKAREAHFQTASMAYSLKPWLKRSLL